LLFILSLLKQLFLSLLYQRERTNSISYNDARQHQPQPDKWASSSTSGSGSNYNKWNDANGTDCLNIFHQEIVREKNNPLDRKSVV
jgi:hypothetical protein